MIPSAADIMAACEAAGRPRTVNAVYSWTSGRNAWPAWALVATADHCGADLDTLTRLAAERWASKHPGGSP